MGLVTQLLNVHAVLAANIAHSSRHIGQKFTYITYKLRWERHAECREMTNAYKVLVRNLWEREKLGHLCTDGRIILKRI
jgi:hypothetical protein